MEVSRCEIAMYRLFERTDHRSRCDSRQLPRPSRPWSVPSECGAVVKDRRLRARRGPVARPYREGCRTFFVAQLREALDLRASLAADCTIFVLNGLDPGGRGALRRAGLCAGAQLRHAAQPLAPSARESPKCGGAPVRHGMSRSPRRTVAEELAFDHSFVPRHRSACSADSSGLRRRSE